MKKAWVLLRSKLIYFLSVCYFMSECMEVEGVF